ncbi:DNA/RNA non-specific endonuclease [Mariniluteicoccus flavus]
MPTPKATPASLRRFVRAHGERYLDDPNISSIGVGLKVVDGRVTDTVALQFTVHAKLPEGQIQSVGSSPLPETITVDSAEVPTDVLERSFVPAYQVVPEAAADARKMRVDPVVPGVSIAHPTVSAGTLGCIVHGAEDGVPLVLSNWHVLHGPQGRIGDTVVQPGPHDDNRVDRNHLGTLVRSHLGVAGDCAVATVEGRGIDPVIMDLGAAPDEIGDPELGDKVVKSGRTTGVTHGVVTRVDVIVELNYGEGVGEKRIGGFEIGPDAGRPAIDQKLSDGGDSGAAWLFRSANGRTSRVLAGLHFGGDAGGGAEHALACLPRSVFEKLQVTLKPTVTPQVAAKSRGYDPDFLAHTVDAPTVTPELARDLVKVDGSEVIDYTHFSLVQSRSRRLARWVAWNVDGGDLRRLSRSSMKFRLDPRVPKTAQVGDEAYAGNRLDRGHIARRADLTWGPDAEQANADSFFFTNIAPQIENFNQGSKGGVWGKLEEAVYAEVDVDRLRISCIGGPVLGPDDRDYRGVRLPREFWKVIAFVEGEKLKARAFLLTQNLDRLETLDLAEFRTFQVQLDDLTARTGVVFPAALTAGTVAEAVSEPRELASVDDIVW